MGTLAGCRAAHVKLNQTMNFSTPLPIDAVLDEVRCALRQQTCAVLVAPPGAGKTTRVPLALMEEDWLKGQKILVLEPRRIAARAAATRMAQTLNEKVGERVGLRARMATQSGPTTRIEVITEGVFTRMILDDPSLAGIGAVLFDEFHERSLDADFGLALALDCQNALRPDLRLCPMSATLDGARVAQLLGNAPVIESQGRAFPVETIYVGRDPRARMEDQMADAITRALRAQEGSLLAFLPGQAEIRRVEERLRERLHDPALVLAALYGAMDMRAQDLALKPAEQGMRKIVLATSIAESSITIEGVRVVIDSGLARVPRYEADVGVARLETVRVSRASADQRRGRAGRTQAGVCYRLWDEAETQSLLPYGEPEIRATDLSGLLLDCAEWGVTDPATLTWLEPPPQAGVKAAREELQKLEALDAEGRITAMGKRLRALPLPARLARMVLVAAEHGQGQRAALIAAVIVERGLGGSDPDLEHRLEAFAKDSSRRARDMRQLAQNWAKMAGAARQSSEMSLAQILALAFPERIGKARGAPGQFGQFRLANGRGAAVEPAHALARAPFLVAAELSGAAAATRILLAAAADEKDILAAAGARIEEKNEVTFDAASAGLKARRVRRLDALVLADDPQPVVANEDTAHLLAQGLARLGINQLPWSKAQQQLRHRVEFLRKVEKEWPAMDDAALSQTAEAWLAPVLMDKTKRAELGADDLAAALDALLPWDLKRKLDALAPTHFEAPTGNAHAIDYEGADAPALHIRVQELYGLTRHPSLAEGKLPLTLHLLSPAHRPIQVTRDLPGFWSGSWSSVKTEMKGRYPRHLWPDDPATATPTHRAKPRGT